MALTHDRPTRLRSPGTLLVPVTIALVATALVTLAFVLWSARGVDDRGLDRQVALAHHIIDGQLERIPHDQESVTVWDDSVIHTRQQFDYQWIDVNLGTWMDSFFGHDEVIVANGANQPIYASRKSKPLALTTAATQLADLQPLVAELRRKLTGGGLRAFETGETEHPPHVSDLVIVGGEPALVSIAPIVSDTGTIAQPRGDEYLHVSMVHLTPEYAQRLSSEYFLPDVAFSGVAHPSDTAAEIVLTNQAGRFVTFLTWTRTLPGQAMLDQTIPVIAIAFLVGGIVALLLIDQIWRKSAALEAGRASAAHRAAHDQLTGLPNRASFEAAIGGALALRRDGGLALMLLDLDHFKRVNDTLGHRAGDELIQAVGQRLAGLVGPDDLLARLSGDEFGIVHHDAFGMPGLEGLSRRIIEALGKPFRIFGSEAFIGVSIGIAIADGSEPDARELARRADIALYEAKATGRSRAVVYEDAMNELLQNRHAMEADLREALRRPGELSVAYQPLFDRANHIVGAEALARWDHQRLGKVSPAHFIGVAEASGLIGQLGAFVLRQACELGARWPGYTLAVNISPAQLRSVGFPAEIFALLRDTGMRPDDLELEITESILLEDATQVSETLTAFRAAGIRIALDDFGTGYSSLNYLKRYPVDRIKIDRSFVSSLSRGSISAAIVQAMVTLAHALQIEVTAEGVETREQHEMLAELGANIFQGYLLSPPVTLGVLEAELEVAQQAATLESSQVA